VAEALPMGTTLFQQGNMTVVPSRIRDIFILENRLRDADREEIWASHHQSAKQALMVGFRNSAPCFTVEVNGSPIAMFGAVPVECDSAAVAWLLGTDDIRKNWQAFLRLSRQCVQNLLEKYEFLYNHVGAWNTESIDWLKWCGAELDEPQAYGIERREFRRFSIKRGDPHV